MIQGKIVTGNPTRKQAHLFRLACLTLLLPMLFACSTGARVVDGTTRTVGRAANVLDGPYGRMDADIGGTPVFYVNPRVMRAEMQVMVHPNVNLEEVPTALFVPFGVTQDMSNALTVSQGISNQLWQMMLQRGTFSVLELARMKPPHRVDMALPIARRLGADMLVGGYVTYYYDGGKRSDSKVSIQLEVYDVATGDMLWSVAHAAVLPYKPNRDYIIGEAASRMPEDPIGTVVRAVGADFAELLHMWTEPAMYEKPVKTKRFFDTAFGSF